jgi:hypothetical protein
MYSIESLTVQQGLMQNILNIDYVSLYGGQAAMIPYTAHTYIIGAIRTCSSIHTSHECQ